MMLSIIVDEIPPSVCPSVYLSVTSSTIICCLLKSTNDAFGTRRSGCLLTKPRYNIICVPFIFRLISVRS